MRSDLKIIHCPTHDGFTSIDECTQCEDEMCPVIAEMVNGYRELYERVDLDTRRKILKWVCEMPDLSEKGIVLDIDLGVNIYRGEMEYFKQFPTEEAVSLLRTMAKYKMIQEAMKHISMASKLSGDLQGDVKDIVRHGQMVAERVGEKAKHWAEQKANNNEDSGS